MKNDDDDADENVGSGVGLALASAVSSFPSKNYVYLPVSDAFRAKSFTEFDGICAIGVDSAAHFIFRVHFSFFTISVMQSKVFYKCLSRTTFAQRLRFVPR